MSSFEIVLQRKTAKGWPIFANHTPPNQPYSVRSEDEFNLDPQDINCFPTQEGYGQALGQAIFRGGKENIKEAFRDALASSRGAGERLHVFLTVEDQELRDLHWEWLYAPFKQGDDFLSRHQETPFSFYLPSFSDQHYPVIARSDLRMLLVVCGREDFKVDYHLDHFDIGSAVEEIRAIAELHSIPCDVLASTEGKQNYPSLSAICERLLEERYTLLHILCHGAYKERETRLYLPGEDGLPITGSSLIKDLNRLRNQDHGGLPHFVFLMSCETAAPAAESGAGGLGQRMVRELGIPAVLAMTAPITINTAGRLLEPFYEEFFLHGEPDRALGEGLAGLMGRFDVNVPAIFSRLGGRPLFRQDLDHPLSTEEILRTLQLFKRLIRERAPVLEPDFEKLENRLGSLSARENATEPRKSELHQVLAQADQLAVETLGVDFHTLAANHQAPIYDDRCPFRGLEAFRPEDRQFFFGREDLARLLAGRLENHNFLAVLGPSGSGKSSLVLAGLLPLLKNGDSPVLLTPGSHPIKRLDAALGEANCLGPVVVDQFEEFFTLTNHPKKRQEFINRLVELAHSRQVILVMRADFWGECDQYPELKNLIQAHREFISPMDTAELRRAIEHQAAAVGLHFEVDLAETILDDVEGEPGAMPLLQHALLLLWQQRRGRWLYTSEYRRFGGVRQAIANTAEAVYLSLNKIEQVKVRQIFIRLTRLDEEAKPGAPRRDTRRKVTLDDLVPSDSSPKETERLVQRLADARLVTTEVNLATKQKEVEVAHEALIRYWPRLRGWLEEDPDLLRLGNDVREAALKWQAEKRSPSLLVHTGSQLDEALPLKKYSLFTLNELEQEYLEACINRREAERRRNAIVFQSVLIGSLVMVVLAVVAIFFALKSVGQSKEVMATALAMQSQQMTDQNRPLSLLLAVEAVRSNPSLVAQKALLDALPASIQLPAVLRGHSDTVTDLAFSPDGRWLASSSADHSTRVWDLKSHQPDNAVPVVLPGQDGKVQSLAFSPDGDWLAAVNEFGTVNLWNRGTPGSAGSAYTPAQTLFDNFNSVGGLTFDPGSEHLLAGLNRKTLYLVDASGIKPEVSSIGLSNSDTGTTPVSLPDPPNGPITALAVSPDDRWLVATCMFEKKQNGENSTSVPCWARIWDLKQSGAKPTLLHEKSLIKLIFTTLSDYSTAAFSPDGRWLVTTRGSILYLRDMTAPDLTRTLGEEPPNYREHSRAITTLVFSPDSRWLVTASNKKSILPWEQDAPIRVWDLSREPLTSTALNAKGRMIADLAISPDSRYLTAGGPDSSLQVWDLQNPNSEPVTFADQNAPIRAVAFSPDGRWLASDSSDHSIWLRSNWLVPSAGLIDLACQAAGRNLTASEWAQYLSGEGYRKTCAQWSLEEVTRVSIWEFWHWGIWPAMRTVGIYLVTLAISILGLILLYKLVMRVLGSS